jgi:hypothetical protein
MVEKPGAASDADQAGSPDELEEELQTGSGRTIGGSANPGGRGPAQAGAGSSGGGGTSGARAGGGRQGGSAGS